jgi:hypothetical protein
MTQQLYATQEDTLVQLMLGSEIQLEAVQSDHRFTSVSSDGITVSGDVLDVQYTTEHTWVVRQNPDGYSLVGLNNEKKPKSIVESPHSFEIVQGDFEQGELWLFFPNRGLLQIHFL